MAISPNYYFQTDNIVLRAADLSDAELLHSWNQDSEMAREYAWLWPPTSLSGTKQWLEKVVQDKADRDELFLIIENRAGEPVGNIGTNRTHRRVGSFQHFFMIRPEHRRQGFASQAILLVMRYYFEELRYQKCTANVYSYNSGSMGLHESLGFLLEGRVRRTVFTGGKHYDEVLYGMTIEEFFERYG